MFIIRIVTVFQYYFLRSQVFQRMLSGPFVESTTNRVVIDDFNPSTVQTFLEFLYSGQIESDKDAADLELLLMVRKLFSYVQTGSEDPSLKYYWIPMKNDGNSPRLLQECWDNRNRNVYSGDRMKFGF